MIHSVTGVAKRRCATLGPMLWVALFAGSPVAAQTPGTSVPKTSDAEAPAQPSAPEPAAKPAYLFDWSGVGAGFGRKLQKSGIYLGSATIVDGAAIASGGLKKGVYGVFQHTLGMDLDLKPLMGIADTAVHVMVVNRYGESNNRAYHGSSYEGLAIAGPVKTTRLTELTIDMSLFDDRLRLLAGRAPSATEYATSDLYCTFVSGICGHIAPFAWSRNSNAGFWPLASWTARATIKPTPETYIRFGVSDVNTASYRRSGFPWNGGWSGKDSIGVFLPLEIGYRTSFANDTHPRAFNIGAFYDSSPYDDPYFNMAGQSRTLFGGAPARHKGRSSVYVQAQQMIWRPDLTARRGLNVFGAALMGVHGIEQTKYHFMAGLVAMGPFASRPQDSLSILAFTNFFDHRVRADYQASLIKTGQPGRAPRGELVLEANYSFGLSPGMQVRPFIQHVVHPDQIGFRPVVGSNMHATIVGLQYSVSIADLIGLPVFQRKR